MAYRYIGNKTRLAPQLLSMVDGLVSPGATVADLMCGTASFSFALRQAGYRVIASDIMTFAAQHAVVRLQLSEPPPFGAVSDDGYEEVLELLNRLDPVNGFMVREYSPAGRPEGGHPPRQYLSEENAGRLDAILGQLRTWELDGALESREIALLHHDAVMAVNEVANIAGTYGHFWSKWTSSSRRRLELTATEFFNFRTDHEVHQGRAEDVSRSLECDVCYLDPPYTKRQYAANYHLLETIARGDEPSANGISGLRPWRDQYSNFCSKRMIRDAFRNVIEGASCPLFLVSYSEDGLLSQEEMLGMLAEHGAVTCFEFPFPRFKSNKSKRSRTLTEFVFSLDREADSGETRVVTLASPIGLANQSELFAA